MLDKPLSGDEGQKRAFDLARALFGDKPDDELRKHMFFIPKSHAGFDSAGNSVTQIDGAITGDVKGKHCIIIDDMIDGGSTMMKASKGLRLLGAASVESMATHGILSNNALKRLLTTPEDDKNAPLDRLTLTDSLPFVEKKRAALSAASPELSERITVLATGSLMTKTVEQLPELSL